MALIHATLDFDHAPDIEDLYPGSPGPANSHYAHESPVIPAALPPVDELEEEVVSENPLQQNTQFDEETPHEIMPESGVLPSGSDTPSLHPLSPIPQQLSAPGVRIQWDIDSVDGPSPRRTPSLLDVSQYTLSIHRSEEFFFEDANLVLISNEDVAFGIHRGVMRRISTVFHDMFEVQLQVPKSETYEGLPFVRLHDSTAIIRTFLQIIYDQMPIELVEAPHKDLLAFCDKYSVDSVLKRILVFLLQTFPDTIEAWDRPRSDEQIKEAVNIAIAAFRLDMKILIPSCLYTIMSYSSSHPYYSTSYSLEKDLHKLPQPLLLNYFHGFSFFATYALNFYRLTLNGRVTPPKGCNKAKCKENWAGFRGNAEYLLRDADYIRHPRPLAYLQKLSTLALTDYNYTSYCDRCREALPEIFNSARRDVWNSLPEVFKIADNWAELRKFVIQPASFH